MFKAEASLSFKMSLIRILHFLLALKRFRGFLVPEGTPQRVSPQEVPQLQGLKGLDSGGSGWSEAPAADIRCRRR